MSHALLDELHSDRLLVTVDKPMTGAWLEFLIMHVQALHCCTACKKSLEGKL